ncbi:MAG TPA: sialate O-acetylesterase [Chitinophagaceae bacterium]|nr:sialate O-acetylesterase [Chitinophagaceae bacterium]
MKSKPFFILFISIVFIQAKMEAQLRLPALISSGMVLQQNDSVALWGWAGPGEKIFITTGWDNRKDSAITSNGAKWKLKVKTPVAGGPFRIDIASYSKTMVLQNVMIGEVWVCSGQSNMEWSYNNGEKDTRTELATCATNNIHFFHIPKTTADAPQDDTKGEWVVCDSNTIKGFSAVGYFFGKKLQQQLNVPIGLINTSWGGTPAEVWTPEELVTNDEILKTAAGKIKPAAWWPNLPGLTYNAMIAPLTSFNIAGAIWYQGESNTSTNDAYNKLFTTMINAWRGAWKKDLPFYYVQIAPYKYGNNNIGALLQEAQTKTMAYPNVGMVVITDLIDSVTNIHPSHKRVVGNRLADWALAETYHRPGINYKNPSYKSAETKGSRLVVSFSNLPNGFQMTDGVIKGFYISGANENWLPAEGKIEKDKMVIWNKQVKQPVHIRYGFGNTLVGNLSSKEGLPLTPFRTDSWPVDQSPVQLRH